MKTRWAFVMIGVVMIVALGCAKREGTTAPVAQSSGPGSASALVSTTATVEDVDQRTRMVTLRTADGEIVHFQGDESMRNLPQVRKGDQVTATYYESIALRLREAEGEQPRIAVSEQVERAPLGEKPAGMVVRNATLTAKVAAIPASPPAAKPETALLPPVPTALEALFEELRAMRLVQDEGGRDRQGARDGDPRGAAGW